MGAADSMLLPALAPGKRFTLPRPVGSADALLLARLAATQSRPPGARSPSSPPSRPTRSGCEDELPFFAPGLRVAVFPDWETLPYDTFSPHQDLISERLATLWRIRMQRDVDVVLLPATTALARLAPPRFLAATTFHFKQKARLDEAALKAQLTLAGYKHVSQVVSPGEYAVRGGLIDLFPMGSRGAVPRRPVRRRGRFDPHLRPRLAAQPVPGARSAPAARPRVPDGRGGAHRLPRALAREDRRRPDRSRASTRTSARASRPPASSTTCRCSSTQTATIFDYFGREAALVLHGEVDEALERFWTDTRERHRFLQHDPERPILPPEEIFLRAEEFFARCNAHAQLALRGAASQGSPEPAAPLRCTARLERRPQARPKPLQRAASAPRRRTPRRVLLVAESEGRRESLLELLRDHRIDAAERRHAGGVRGRRRTRGDRGGAAGGRLPLVAATAPRSSSSPRPSCSPPRRPRAGAASRSRSATSTR